MMLYNNLNGNDYDEEFEEEYGNMKFDYNSLDHDLFKQESSFKNDFDGGLTKSELDGLVIEGIDDVVAKLPIKMERFDNITSTMNNIRMAHSQDNINMNLRMASTVPEESRMAYDDINVNPRMAYDDINVNTRIAYDDTRISHSHDEINHVNYNNNNNNFDNKVINYDSYIQNRIDTTIPFQNYQLNSMMYSNINNFDLNYCHSQDTFDLNVANQMSIPGNVIPNIPNNAMNIPNQQVLHQHQVQQITQPPVAQQPIAQQIQPQVQQQVAIAQPPAQAYNSDYNDYLAKFKRYKIIRGISAGGCNSRPPKLLNSNSKYYLTELKINGANLKDICLPYWSKYEKLDKRRIIRIERLQQGPKLIVNFQIIGSAHENPIMVPSNPGIDVVEVSCLECQINDYDSSDDESKSPLANDNFQYYITSVEVIEIVELLIGNQSKDPIERRKERGRVRSNLVPFWSKKPISSRMNDSPKLLSNHDYKLELAKRIMGYEIRKPRGFDKEVRILRWDKLVPALKRALQSYYTEIPEIE